jgi:pimeloyl-ACP methyl ester carboxylesterase
MPTQNPGIQPFFPPKEKNRTAIVFVHGFSGDRAGTWGDIPSLLAADKKLSGWDMYGFGYPSHKSFDILGLWTADPALNQIATRLNGEPMLSPERYDALALVAHSMGGLVVQSALVKYAALRRRTTHVFLFGTPSAGLVKARLLSFLKPQIRNMSASGGFIKELRDAWTKKHFDTAPPFAFLATAGELDQFVPPKSSLDPFPEAFRRVIPGNHLSMLQRTDTGFPAVEILIQGLTGGKGTGVAFNAARVAVETGRFQDAIEQLLPIQSELDDGGAVQLAIALDRRGRREEAIQVLKSHRPEGTDILGVLAGRLKRRWQVSRRAEDIASARDLYNRAYQASSGKTPPNHDQAYYHAINLAYFSLAASDRDELAAREWANKALVHCAKATDPTQKFWRLATEGDALMILGRSQEGFEKHSSAVATSPQPWQAFSAEDQALRVADLSGLDKEFIKDLANKYEAGEL